MDYTKNLKDNMSYKEADTTSRVSEVYNAISNKILAETNLFWSRFNTLIFVNMAFLAFTASFDYSKNSYFLIFDFFGIGTAILVLIVTILGRRWIGYWENRIFEIEKHLPKPHLYPGNWDKNGNRRKNNAPASMTKLTVYLSVFISVMWVAKMLIIIITII